MIKNKKRFLTVTACLSAALYAHTALANGWSWHTQLGAAWPSLHNSQWVSVTPTVQNRYDTTGISSSGPIVGVGVGYQFDHPYNTQTAWDLGVTAYYLSTQVTGTNYPAVNGTSNPDTLTYNANGSSYALLFEPKWVYTAYRLQPYFLGGLGIALNHAQAYSETPNGTSLPSTPPFQGGTQANLAFELGAGIQYALSPATNAPLITLDYRYLNWGGAGLSKYTGQATQDTLSLGTLRTSLVMLGVVWPF